MIINDIITVACVAAAGGIIGYKLRLPVGGMLGAVAAVLAYNLIFEPEFYLPLAYRVVLQLSFGPFIGSRITKNDLISLKKLAFPAAVMITCLLLLNIICGIILYRISDLNIQTALFSTAPGGMMDMAIISADMGANYVYVALIQLSRVMIIITCMFPFYKKMLIKLGAKGEGAQDSLNAATENLPPEPYNNRRKAMRFFMTCFCGFICGLTLWSLNIPAGAIIGSMLGAAAFNIVTGKGYFYQPLRLPLQIFAGSFIGAGMDRQSLIAMNEIIIPVVFIFFYVMIITAVTAYTVHKLTGLDLYTSFLSATPGGLGEMSMMADELKIDVPKIVVMHLARLMSVIALFPFVLSFVIWIAG